MHNIKDDWRRNPSLKRMRISWRIWGIERRSSTITSTRRREGYKIDSAQQVYEEMLDIIAHWTPDLRIGFDPNRLVKWIAWIMSRESSFTITSPAIQTWCSGKEMPKSYVRTTREYQRRISNKHLRDYHKGWSLGVTRFTTAGNHKGVAGLNDVYTEF